MWRDRHAKTASTAMSNLTQRIDLLLIEQGHDPQCVMWVCDQHARHCVHIDTEHAEHECYWCERLDDDNE